MPMPLHAPPPLTHQDGLPPFSAQRASLTHTADTITTFTSPSATAQRTPPIPLTVSASSSAQADRHDNSAVGRHRMHPQVWSAVATHDDAVPTNTTHYEAGAPRPFMPDARTAAPVEPSPRAAVPPSPSAASSFSATSSSSSSSSSSSTLQPRVLSSNSAQRRTASAYSRSPPPQRSGAGDSQATSSQRLPETHDASTYTLGNFGSDVTYAADESIAGPSDRIALPLPVVVQQQAQRIREVLQERDSLADELRELRNLFQHLRDDYDGTVRESEARQLRLDMMQTQYEIAQEELRQLRALYTRQDERVLNFEMEWEEKSRHLREQLDAVLQERDSMQAQRDTCLNETSELRRTLIDLQGAMYAAETKHREALRVQKERHDTELRDALREKDEQLQARVAATRHEARLTQQQMAELGTVQSIAQEDRDTLRWRLREMEAIVEKKEELRGELARLVDGLRARISEQDQQLRSDAQRYTKHTQELEQTYARQVAHEQHRCTTLQEELAAARRALQEARREQETAAEVGAARVREVTARAERQEEQLRDELRRARAELMAAQSSATQHEAVAHRCQRDVEAMRSAATAQQAEQHQLQEAHTMQRQSLLRAEGTVEVLKTRLREKEREAELLRTTMEHATWTREMRESAQHTLSAMLGVSRAQAMTWLKSGSTEKDAAALQLEWSQGQAAQAAAASLASPAKGAPAPSASTVQQGRSDGAIQKRTSRRDGFDAQKDSSAGHVGEVDSAAEGADEDEDEEEEERDLLRSPVRAAGASTQAGATQHIESIERTAARSTKKDKQSRSIRSGSQEAFESDRPFTSPISVLRKAPQTPTAASPPHAYGPPLHPNSAHLVSSAAKEQNKSPPPSSTTGTATIPSTSASMHVRGSSQRETHVSSPSESAAVGGARGAQLLSNTSPSASTSQLLTSPLQRLSFTSAATAVGVPRHQYNVTEHAGDSDALEESTEQPNGGMGVDSQGRGTHPTAAQMAVETEKPPAAAVEVFFDSHLASPSAWRSHMAAYQRAPSTPTPSATTAHVAADRRAASMQPAHSTRNALKTTNATATMARHTRSDDDHPRHSSTTGGGATAGVRAAELIAQLTPYTPVNAAAAALAAATAPSITSTPVSSASAAAARRQRVNFLTDSEDGLQRYLKETVQQVLSDQQGFSAPHPHHPTSVPRPLQPPESTTGVLPYPQQATLPSKAARGHVHYTEMYAGSPLRSTPANSRVEEDEEEDFGSVSRPRSVLSALPAALQRPPPPPQQRREAGPAHTGTAPHHVATPEGTAAQPGKTRASKQGAMVALHGSAGSPPSSASRLLESGVSNTLEQLARRQQQLLQSLEDSSSGGGARHIEHPSAPPHVSDRDSADSQPQLSAMTSSDAALDPRQLSYATTTTITTNNNNNNTLLDGSAARTPWGQQGRAPLAAEWRVPANRLGWRDERGSAANAVPHHTSAQRDIVAGQEASQTAQTPVRESREKLAASPPASVPSSFSTAASALNQHRLPTQGTAAATLSSVSTISNRGSAEQAAALPQRFSKASETDLHDAVARVDGGRGSTAGSAEHAVEDDGYRVGRASRADGASAVTSVSDASSLTQLEKQLAAPFTQ